MGLAHLPVLPMSTHGVSHKGEKTEYPRYLPRDQDCPGHPSLLPDIPTQHSGPSFFFTYRNLFCARKAELILEKCLTFPWT